LKGRFYLNKWSEAGFQKSIEFFEAAISQDPNMAAAHAGLADARFVLGCYGKVAPRECMPKALRAAEKAMELDASLSDAHVSLGAVRAIYEWDWVGSEQEFQRAIDLDPDSAPAWQWYGVLCLLPRGRREESAAAIRRALDLDPLSPAIHTSLGLVYFVQGSHDEAIAYFQKALELDANFSLAHWWLGVIYLQRSMLLKAFAAFRKAGVVSQKTPLDVAKFTYGEALVGKRGKARRLLEELTRISREQYFSPAMIAAIHVVLGETDAAFDWLEKAYEARDSWLVWLAVDRRFDRIRSDPRFAALLNRMGIDAAVLPVNG
jgi:tetratricopeptide (TPR) repeat protein